MATKFGADIFGSPVMNPNDFIIFHAHICGFGRNISTRTGNTAMKFTSDIHVPQRINHSNFGDPLISFCFPLASSFRNSFFQSFDSRPNALETKNIPISVGSLCV